MKIARIEWHGEPRMAAVAGDEFIVYDRDVSLLDLTTCSVIVRPDQIVGRIAVEEAQFLVPTPSPRKIVAVGLNYLDHAAESRIATPAAPLLFAKTPNALLPHKGVIVSDQSITSQVDFEGELTAIIGRRIRNVSVDAALEGIFGYTIANDVSARDVQFSDGQWMRGKSFDTFCPLGPYVLTADEVPDPQQLRIVTRLNDVVMQEDDTSAMIFSVSEIISYISRSMTLEPGDVVLTGTPAGVGFARTPPVFLGDGDTVSVTIDPIGVLRNSVCVVEEGPPAPATTAPATAQVD